jgi:hypothetical protein
MDKYNALIVFNGIKDCIQEFFQYIQSEYVLRRDIRFSYGETIYDKSDVNPGWNVYVYCSFLNDKNYSHSDIALIVSFEKLQSNPIMFAEVVWDDPSGHMEADWEFEGVEVSEENVNRLLAELPHLFQVFEEAVQRGYPSNR